MLPVAEQSITHPSTDPAAYCPQPEQPQPSSSMAASTLTSEVVDVSESVCMKVQVTEQ